MWSSSSSQQPAAHASDEAAAARNAAQHPPASSAAGAPQHDPRLASLAAAYQPTYPPASSNAATGYAPHHHHAYGVAPPAPQHAWPPPQAPPPPNGDAYAHHHHHRYGAAHSHHAPQHHTAAAASNGNGASMLKPPPPAAASAHHHRSATAMDVDQEDDSGDNDDASSDEEVEDDHSASTPQPPMVPRGKPEAMAKSLAAARRKAAQEEALENERQAAAAKQRAAEASKRLQQHDSDEDDEDEEEVVAEPVQAEGGVLVQATATAPPAATATATKKSPKRARSKSPKKTTTARKKAATTKSPKAGAAKRGSSASAASLSISQLAFLQEPTHPISAAEYDNLEALMVQFCRVPLLAEFSRPVSLLHPELSAAYSKIVSHAVDLGHVCRGIRRRQYQNTRDIRLDMWRVFANCVKFHSHPNNKEAVPSFVSIALHLREFFNNLWQEFMMPSDLPSSSASSKTGLTDNPRSSATKEQLRAAFDKRQQERRRNLENSGVLVLNEKITSKTAKLLGMFIDQGGCTDGLDNVALFGPNSGTAGTSAGEELKVVVANLRQLQQKLSDMTDEYTVDSFHRDLVACYTSDDILEESPATRNLLANRLNRLFWKLLIPLHEANSRGVTQSSIWGNIAATIWARESSKKPFWPALCLGILPPADQREGWHDAVTERNEARLPEKLRMQLETAKKKCLQAQKRQNLSYFLVEFLGTHEFIWVRETDIVENFDPDNDPNKKATLGKKKRSSRSGVSSVVNSKMYATALEECVWANEEYESVLQDAFDCHDDDDANSENGQDKEDDEEMNYSYSILSQSDDEADDADKHHFTYDASNMSMSDIDEANWLFEHEGLLDLSAAGRKNAKKRAQLLKKKAAAKKASQQKSEAAAAAKSSSKSHDASSSAAAVAKKKAAKQKDKTKELKKEQKELEKRRKKRMREREKALRSEAKKHKRRRGAVDDGEGGDAAGDSTYSLAHDKRARASAIVRGYLTRMANDDGYKSLGLNGVMAIPAAMVDSTGLLGMALAFRAAAGEISMPDESATEQQTARLKPWTAVDTKSGKTSAERSAALEKQAALLKQQVDRVRANTQRRKDLAREAIAQRLRLESEIEADEEAARRNHFKKKKKYPTKPPPPAAATPKESSPDASDKPAVDAVVVATTPANGDDDKEEENGGEILHAEPVDEDVAAPEEETDAVEMKVDEPATVATAVASSSSS